METNIKKQWNMYKRVSINTSGATMTVTQTATNLSKALEQELKYRDRQSSELAQVNIEFQGKVT